MKTMTMDCEHAEPMTDDVRAAVAVFTAGGQLDPTFDGIENVPMRGFRWSGSGTP